MRVGGPTDRLVVAESTAEVLDAVKDSDSRDPANLLLFGGGSNLVVGDEGWQGTTVQVKSSRLRVEDTDLIADAGCDWDSVVAGSIAAGLSGLEALSGIPGSVGGTPVQNVGAFGVLTQQRLKSVEVYDRQTQLVETWDAARCSFGSHRQSAFKHTDRFVVLSVRYGLRRSAQSDPITFQTLTDRLGVEVGGTASTQDVRDAVIQLRRSKGSIYDAKDPDTWGTGSFFINHVCTPAEAAIAIAAGCETYPDPPMGPPNPDVIKLPAAWLIEHSGFKRGWGANWGRGSVRLSSKHALAVSNHSGDATTSEVMAFAAHIRDGIESRYGIRLGPECDLVNCSFDDALTSNATRTR